MEKKNIDLEIFKKDYFFNLSDYFVSLFGPCVISVSISENKKIALYIVKLDEKFTNIFKKVHGGAIATLIENLSNASLKYFTSKNFYTIDFNINYINTVDINMNLLVFVNCLRFEGLTSFIDVEIKENENVLIKASLIKTAIYEKF